MRTINFSSNKAFWRAIHSLAHPVTIAAVIGLLLNDHLLRHNWPSWWTGKLSLYLVENILAEAVIPVS